MQSNFSEFMNVTGAGQRNIQNVTSGDVLIYRGVTYIRQQQQTKANADAQTLPADTTLHYRGATYRLTATGNSSAAQAQQKAASWLIYRGVAYRVERFA